MNFMSLPFVGSLAAPPRILCVYSCSAPPTPTPQCAAVLQHPPLAFCSLHILFHITPRGLAPPMVSPSLCQRLPNSHLLPTPLPRALGCISVPVRQMSSLPVPQAPPTQCPRTESIIFLWCSCPLCDPWLS